MAEGKTYGINFPFQDSRYGNYFSLSQTNGTRLYEYIFEPLDGPTFSDIESEIRESVDEYLPSITITNIEIKDASTGLENKGTYINDNDERVFKVPGISDLEHTAKIKIDYRINNDAFNQSDFVIINI